MSARYYLFTAIICLILAGCQQDKKPAAGQPNVSKKAAVMEPFRYHKAIEVSPGQTYDILSWGRGSTAAGAFMILHSDSAGIKYTTTTGDLDGTITDVYNADMDVDGNPEILIQSKGKDTINFTRIYAFEFNGSQANKLDFPKLNNSQKKGYRGNDNFYIRDGKLIREFMVFDGNTSSAKSTGQKRQLEYGLRSNSFTVKQLSKDSVMVNTDQSVVSQPVNSKASVKKENSSQRSLNKKSRQKSKKTKTEPKKKKRRHRG